MALRNIFNMTRNQFCVDSIDANTSIQLDEVDITSGGGGGGGSQNLSQVLTVGSDGGGQSIGNVENITVNNTLIVGQTEGSQIHMNTSAGTNFQLVGTSGDSLVIQEYNNNTLTNEQLQIQGSVVNVGDLYSANPVVSILGSRGLGRIYDNLYNPPSGGGGSTVVANVSLTSTISQTLLIDTAIPLMFDTVDAENGVGASPVTTSAQNIFRNTGSSEILVLIHLSLIFPPATDPSSSRSIFIRKNGSNTNVYGQVVQVSGTLSTSLSTSTVLVMQPNDAIEAVAYHNDSVVCNLQYTGGNTPSARLMFTRLL